MLPYRNLDKDMCSDSHGYSHDLALEESACLWSFLIPPFRMDIVESVCSWCREVQFLPFQKLNKPTSLFIENNARCVSDVRGVSGPHRLEGYSHRNRLSSLLLWITTFWFSFEKLPSPLLSVTKIRVWPPYTLEAGMVSENWPLCTSNHSDCLKWGTRAGEPESWLWPKLSGTRLRPLDFLSCGP